MPDRDQSVNTRTSVALAHLKQGFAAFSVWSTTPSGQCRCRLGAACTGAGKHPIPEKGFHAASTDPKTVSTMLSADSQPNYGLVWPDGPDVVFSWDLDGPTWRADLNALQGIHGPLPRTKTTTTPSGGRHAYYRWPQGVPVPDGNRLHGFVVRWPMKGYVVGPGSRINGAVYTSNDADIADFPLAWAESANIGANRAESGDIRESEGFSGESAYALPESVETGHRHDEITRFVASRWNKGLSRADIEIVVRRDLVPAFTEPPSEAKLRRDIDEAIRTAEKKWGIPGGVGPTLIISGGGTTVEIDPLAIESRIERPAALDLHAFYVPVGLSMLLDHFQQVCDAPDSSLALASSVVMSALVGTQPSVEWRGHHRVALFGCLVGHSGYGRKGATMREVEKAFGQVDPVLDTISTGGLASGEVLVDILNEAKQNSIGTSLIWEHEIANVLILAAREGNIMSGNLRRAWDGDKVESRSRKSGRAVAIGYNVAFMGGVTPSELEKRLTANDIANGWANRFLWFWSEKAPRTYDTTGAGYLDDSARDYLIACIDFARNLVAPTLMGRPMALPTMHLTPAAHARLDALAASLDIIPVGAIGALRQRMPLHIVRLAAVAALFDQTSEISTQHVEFGERMTTFAIDSMRAVFGTRIDDEVAKTIIDILKQAPDGWLNTSTIAKAIRKDGSRTNRALQALLDVGWVVREDRRTQGRTAIGYRLRAF